MSDINLPPLPMPLIDGPTTDSMLKTPYMAPAYFTIEQLQAYARAAVLADREAREGWRLLKDSTANERAWPDGNYFQTCNGCLREFLGRKYQRTCNVCDAERIGRAAASLARESA